MSIYEVFADFTITKSVGKFEANSEEEAILKAGNKIRDKYEKDRLQLEHARMNLAIKADESGFCLDGMECKWMQFVLKKDNDSLGD